MKTRITRGLEGLLVGLIGLMGMICDCDGQTTNAPQIYPLTGQASSPGTLTNFLIVSKTGSDASGARNNYGLPFGTITAAKAVAVAGDVIYVLPGVWQENNLLKPYVHYCFAPGVKLLWFASTNGSVSGGTPATGYGFFDDRATGGTTNIIGGVPPDCYYSYGTNFTGGVTGNTNVAGMIICTTNPNTVINAEFDRVDGDAFVDTEGPLINGNSVSPALFYISKTRLADVRVSDMSSSLRDWTTAQVVPSFVNGFYWEAGETYFTSKHIGNWRATTYAIWPNDTSTDQHSDNFWVRGGQCEGYIYASVNSTNVRCWYTYDENRVTNNSAYNVIGGKQYISALKVSSTLAGVAAIGSSQADLWVTAQKITAPGGGQWFSTDSGNVYLKVHQYECPSGLLAASGGFSFTIGGLARITIDGGEAFADGLGIKWATSGSYNNNSLLVVKNLGLDTSKADHSGNNSISVGTNGVIVVGSRFKVPASATASITAAAPQTVGTYWSAANVTTNGNITFTPNAGWTVNAAVR